MIKFFRHIRKSLLMENKTSKYFKYAIGEIVLVVIGILIALQINNWNQKRLERIEENTILTNLKDDFKNAITEFKYLNMVRDDIISASTIIYNKQPKEVKNYPTKYLDSVFFKTMSAPTYNNKAGSLNLLLTSGKINLIAKEDLKNKLIQWPGDVSDMVEDEIAHADLYLQYGTILDKYISWNDVFKQKSFNTFGSRFKAITINSFNESERLTSDYKSILEDKVFLNLLNRRVIYCQLTKNETISLIEKAQNLIAIIDKELSNDKIL